MPEYYQGASPFLPSVPLLEWWKPVVGFEAFYEVSNVGNVCRIKKSNTSRPGQHLKVASHWDGRLFVVLNRPGIRKTKKIHKLMVDSFFQGTPPGMTVHHKNDDYKKNWLSNFAFLTALDNWRDAYNKGLTPRGERSGNAKITEAHAAEILSLRGSLSLKEISKRYGITTTAASYIWQGRNWSHVRVASGLPPYRKTVLKGNELPHALLTPEKVGEIRKEKGKVNSKVLAKQYGVSESTIYRVWSRKIWTHVE